MDDYNIKHREVYVNGKGVYIERERVYIIIYA